MNMKPFNEKNIEQLLKCIKNQKASISISKDFTASVMDRIRAEESASFKSFESIYKKFLIIGSVAAVIAIIISINFMFSANPFNSEYSMIDILNGNIF